ncbi:MAG TPA: metallophosphoesterase family protein [Planctomycetota bacterium]|nr:metallophosphoesterase family protein [Planctomycetota bacterium]
MIAIISDIHGNREAFKRVLADIESIKPKIERIYCLGDIIGYGPNPADCLDLAIRHCNVTIRGNHEEAVLNGPVDFNPRAEAAIVWTQQKLQESPSEIQKRNNRYLDELKDTAEPEDGVLLVHGTPRQPTREYLFPHEIGDPGKMKAIFELIPRYCFVGHSHIPGIFTESGEYIDPKDLMKGIYMLDDTKCIINVGSVGQPRDNDPRASYCTFNGDCVIFRRVDYDRSGTMLKIYSETLPKSLGNRLARGK